MIEEYGEIDQLDLLYARLREAWNANDKFRDINFQHLRIEAFERIGRDDKPKYHTIEFRAPNGTVDPNLWIENINLYGGLMRASKELAVIQSKNIHELTESDIRKLELLQRIKSHKIPEQEKLSLLLELLLPEEQRQTYVDRYEVNMPLIEANESLQKVMKKHIAEETVDLTHWRPTSRVIGEYCYTNQNSENEPVDGSEAKQTEDRFRRDLHLALEVRNNNVRS